MATAFSLDTFLKGPSLSRVRQVEQGLPASAMRQLVDGKAVTLADLAGIVAPRRTLDRRLADNAPLTPEESDRLARFAEVLALATHVFGDRAAAMEWLRAPQFDFDGTPPISLMRTYSGGDLVTDLLNRFRYGMLA